MAYDCAKEGYNQAIEDNKDKLFSLVDMKEAIAEAWNSCEDNEDNETFTHVFSRIIKSNQPKTEWECEIIDGKLKLI